MAYTDEQIEAAAKALRKLHDLDSWNDWNNVHESVQEQYRKEACTALEAADAAREPAPPLLSTEHDTVFWLSIGPDGKPRISAAPEPAPALCAALRNLDRALDAVKKEIDG